MRRSLKFLSLALIAALWSIHGPASIAAPAPPTEAVVMLDEPAALPDWHYVTEAGEEARLEDLAGKVVILNFWATWCAPCVKEMPHLDRLKAKLPEDHFQVLVLSVDRGGDKKARPFLDDLGMQHLAADLDPRSTLARAMGLRGMPTTFIIGKEGTVLAKLEGIAEWDSPEFVAWFEALAAE